MPVGTYGKITSRPAAPGGQHRARCKFRDYDGQVRLVERTGRTKSAAEANLKAALRDRQGPASGQLSRDSRVRDLAASWLDQIERDPELADGSKEAYGRAVRRYVLPAVGALRLGECTVAPIDRALTAISAKHGPGAAKTARSVMSGMFSLAARHDAIISNPVRDASKISIPRKRVRALTDDETDRIVDALRCMQRAVDLDLPDLVEWMLGTGCRIGEACALRHGTNSDGKPLLDLGAGTWEVNATIIRRGGSGLHIQERPKTAAGWRVLALPPHLVTMVHRRAGEARLRAPSGIVFGSPAAKSLRDPSNTPGDLREVLDAIECPTCQGSARVHGGNGRPKKCPDAGPFAWVHSHTFRKTAATRMEEAGCTPREVADQLGHSRPSMTMDVYFGRPVVTSKAAIVLAR